MARWHDSMTRLDEGESALVSVPSSAPLPIHHRGQRPLGTACSCLGSPCVVSAKDRGSTALRKQLLQTRFSAWPVSTVHVQTSPAAWPMR